MVQNLLTMQILHIKMRMIINFLQMHRQLINIQIALKKGEVSSTKLNTINYTLSVNMSEISNDLQVGDVITVTDTLPDTLQFNDDAELQLKNGQTSGIHRQMAVQQPSREASADIRSHTRSLLHSRYWMV